MQKCPLYNIECLLSRASVLELFSRDFEIFCYLQIRASGPLPGSASVAVQINRPVPTGFRFARTYCNLNAPGHSSDHAMRGCQGEGVLSPPSAQVLNCRLCGRCSPQVDQDIFIRYHGFVRYGQSYRVANTERLERLRGPRVTHHL